MLSLALVLIVLGAILLLQHLGVITMGWGTLWPSLLIAWGVGMFLGRIFRRS